MSEVATVHATQRHYGIDALRILSMFLVVILHVLGFGGVLYNATPFSSTFVVGWVLETVAMCSVNCYGLISGYVGIKAKYRYSNLVLLWLQVWLYSVGITLIFWLIDPGSVPSSQLLRCFFPVASVDYWYISAYVGLYLFIPCLNFVVDHLNRQQAKFLCWGMVLLFSLMPMLFGADPFSMTHGYSMAWLVALYILGACIRKHDFLRGIRSSSVVIACVLSVLAAVGSKLLLISGKIEFLSKYFSENILLVYTAPTILMLSVGLLLLCARKPSAGRIQTKIVGWFAPVALGVYIIHLHQVLYLQIFNNGIFKPLGQMSPVIMVGGVLLGAAVIFLVCALIDRLRLWIFKKLRLRQRMRALEDRYLPDLWVIKTQE